jgi:endogenous inhibitor of DNA gyrase (YacG/DUF329 family)
MPVAPKPFTYVCPKCGYKVVHKPKSDNLQPADIGRLCPKCATPMEKKPLNEAGVFNTIMGLFR